MPLPGGICTADCRVHALRTAGAAPPDVLGVATWRFKIDLVRHPQSPLLSGSKRTQQESCERRPESCRQGELLSANTENVLSLDRG